MIEAWFGTIVALTPQRHVEHTSMTQASEAFSGIEKIRYEGPAATNMLAFRHYDADALVEGKPMRDHLRFAVSYWHTFRGTGGDPFGPGTMIRPWEAGSDSLAMAPGSRRRGLRVSGETRGRLLLLPRPRRGPRRGDAWPRATRTSTPSPTGSLEHQERTGIKLLWGTANLFSNPRYVHGAATSRNVESFAYAAAQVKKAIEVTHRLGGAGYTFWGGREGYQCLWNTDMKRELDHLAAFMHMAVDYAKEIGFTGQFYFEPKPREPMKHQYDFDVATCINFLRTYGLEKHVKMNIETNHATLAGHEMQHELEYAGLQGFLGSIDANTGDTLVGWDTDQFPTNIYLTTQMMYTILKYGGLAPGGINFDAKVRRESFEPVDLFHAHIGGMDAFARGLKIAAAMRADGAIQKLARRAVCLLVEPARQADRGGHGVASRRSRRRCSPRARPPPAPAAARNSSRTWSTPISEPGAVPAAERPPRPIAVVLQLLVRRPAAGRCELSRGGRPRCSFPAAFVRFVDRLPAPAHENSPPRSPHFGRGSGRPDREAAAGVPLTRVADDAAWRYEGPALPGEHRRRDAHPRGDRRRVR